MKTGEVSQLVFKYGLGVVKVDELGLVGLQFDHMPYVAVLTLHVSDQGYSGGGAWLGKLQHFKHPVRYIAQSLVSHKLQHSTIRHSVTVLQAKN